MIVRHDVAVVRYDDATACSMTVGLFVFALLRLSAPAAKAEEIAKEIAERVLNLNTLRLARLRYLNIYYRTHSTLGSRSQIDITACRSNRSGRNCHWFGRERLTVRCRASNNSTGNCAAAQNEKSSTHPILCCLFHSLLSFGILIFEFIYFELL